jgi:hypothetical protein
LTSLTSIRTSGDHGYLIGPGELWAWFLITNVLARSLGLHPYKDVFRSDRTNADHHAEVEALLSALSTGPVGIGDPAGRADRDLVLRTCRADGVLVRPDVPLAVVDQCFAHHPVARAVPLVAEAWSDHAAGRWTYAVTLNVCRAEQRLDQMVDLAELGTAAPHWPVACWDWRTATATRLEPNDGWPIALDPLEWDLRVLAPILPAGIAVIGDPTRYATAGDARLGAVEATADGVRFTVLGAGEFVTIVGWAEHRPVAASRFDLAWDAPVWRIGVSVPSSGSAIVELSAAP